MKKWHLGVASSISCVAWLAAFSSGLFAQAPASAPIASGDAMAKLLVEVQAIRQEVREASTVSIRSQLLVARLQLQEQRLMHLVKQRADASTRLTTAEQAGAAIAAQLKMFEQDESKPKDPNDDGNFDFVMKPLKAQVAHHQATADAMKAEIASIDSAITAEQARWTEFNARLDELEALLTRRQ